MLCRPLKHCERRKFRPLIDAQDGGISAAVLFDFIEDARNLTALESEIDIQLEIDSREIIEDIEDA